MRTKEKRLEKRLSTDFTTCIPWNQINERWGKREYARFIKWMRGQTCLREGAYESDVMRYAEARNDGIKDPVVYD